MIENNFPNLYEDSTMVIYLNAALPYTDEIGRAHV